MFDKFGEFDTYEEFEAAAEGFMKEGDTNSIRELAKENGLDPLDAEDYITGDTKKLTDPASYAMARIELELKETKADKAAAAYIASITRQVLSSKGKQAHFVGKHIDEIMKALEKKSREKKQQYACGSDRDMEKIVEAYYLKSEREMKKVVNEL